ncbi:MAG: xanthine dehydrogenase family protein subunit M [Nocardioidaceae bacterium]
MKPAPFDYHRPSSLDEAVDVLAVSEGKVLAGGQSLVPIMSMRLAAPSALVDINHIAGLDTIEVGDAGVRIGALTRHSALEHDQAAFAANPLLRRTVSHVAHPTIRNRGTTVGSLVHADPAAEMPAVLSLLGGRVEAMSRDRGTRRIDAKDFFVGPLESALQPDEIAVAAYFPNPNSGTGSAWVELARRHGDYAIVGVGALVEVDSERRVTVASVALISVGLTPVVVDLSEACAQTSYDEQAWDGAIELVSQAIEPEADIHASADYRAHLACVLTRRALIKAAIDAVDQEAA